MKININQLHLDDILANFKKFINALKQESKETKTAFKMLYNHAINTRKMNDIEKEWVGTQMSNVLKTIGLTTIALMPGGMIVALLIKALKLQKYILPSSFEYMNKN
jgi:hypothetical protein